MPLSLPSLHPHVTLRNLLLLLALLNLKTLPFAWHLRLLQRFLTNFLSPTHVRRILSQRKPSSTTTNSPASTHPIFLPVSITTHAPLYESDYNLHKSNSTYFTDLDESRTALVTRLYGPAFRKNDKTLEKQGIGGRVSVILGSVHTSFHKEIRMYELYEVRSRVMGWDRKWLVVGSWFVRRGKGGKDGEGEVLLASSLSKYVVKKGRFTVSPARCLELSGWLPAAPTTVGVELEDRGRGRGGGGEMGEKSGLVREREGEKDAQTARFDGDEGIRQPVPETVLKTADVVERLERVASNTEGEEPEVDASIAQAPRAVEWDWHRIEMERLRGLQLVNGWLELDEALKGEYNQTPH